MNGIENLKLVVSEIAVSVLLSSVAKRDICPNFVITQGVFTCQYEPPASIWGRKDDTSPRGTSFNRQMQPLCEPAPELCGK